MTALHPAAAARLDAHRPLHARDVRVADLEAVLDQPVDLADYPVAAEVAQGVLVYDADDVRAAAARGEASREALMAELALALSEGPGVVVLRGAVPHHDVVDRVTAAFDAMIADEEAAGGPAGDHFATPGANSRVWNALEKLAVRDPEAFVDYYGHEVLALVSEAWLGPGFQVTSQVNVVRPGGKAQDPHRDYHLGFLADEEVERYPRVVHRLSPALTLQGAVAHTDMPLESGPTLYLPGSHRYEAGYLAWRNPEVRALVERRRVQLPLAKGDAAFFNPAVMHGAGSNVSADLQRMANLLQVSSAFGRAMEAVDRARTTRAVYPALLARKRAGTPAGQVAAAVACAAEGYPFPTNLDLDQPVDGLTPPSQADLVHRALADDVEPAELDALLDAHDARRRTHDGPRADAAGSVGR